MTDQIKFISGSVTAPQGFSAAGIHCGIRKNKAKKDLALVFAQKTCDAAAIYTQNKVKGAPILVTREHLKDGKARAMLCNSGNANTCNPDGVEKANAMCGFVAKELEIAPEEIIIASTGVIGQVIPIEPVRDHAAALVAGLSAEGAQAAEEAIMTTDTRRKEFAVEFALGGKTCRIGGMAKGSGMINPNMATMLAFLTSDADISAEMLKAALLDTVTDSFNMVSVDGDTSTNDMVSVMASGLAGNRRIEEKSGDYETFSAALSKIMVSLAREIARDGEGATKLLECEVTGAPDKETARKTAKAVISSNLLKAAMFGSDANWGRVLCAIGYAPVEVEIDKIDVSFESVAGSITVCKGGAGVDFSEDEALSILNRGEVRIIIHLNSGEASARAWGCDLTYDYVKINGDYRT